MIDPSQELPAMMNGGVAVVVATAGSDARPAITRGWAPTYDVSSSLMTLAVTAPAGSPTLINLESNGLIAVTVSEPITYKTVQLKGEVEEIAPPAEQDRIRALQHLGRFVEDVAQIGVTQGADSVFLGDLRVVSFLVEQLYEQTPGADAGKSLK